MAFVEFAYGKPPQKQELSGLDGGKIVVKLVNDD